MRRLVINNTIVDIDEQTAIGIDLQAYDFKDPGKLKVNVSNTFSIPATSKNLELFGFPGNPHRNNGKIYEKLTVDYYVRNTLYIEKGSVRVQGISGGRINLFVTQRPAFVELMKQTKLLDFLEDWFNNSFVNTTFANFSEMISAYVNDHNGITIPFYAGNLKNFPAKNTPVEFIGVFYMGFSFKSLSLGVLGSNGTISHGSHFCVYINQLFQHIENYFNVNIGSSNTNIATLFNDSEFNSLYVPVRQININENPAIFNLQFNKSIGEEGELRQFTPVQNTVPYKDLTVYDLFINTIQLLGFGIEQINKDTFELLRFDLIGNIQTPDNLPGKMVSDYLKSMEFTPGIEGYGIENTIKMRPYADGGELLGAKIIISNNENADTKKDLFTVNAFVPGVFQQIIRLLPDQFIVSVPNMSESESFKYLTFLKHGRTVPDCTINGWWAFDNETELATPPANFVLTDINEAIIYTVSGEYQFYEGILTNPESVKVRRWVTASELDNFRKIAAYYVRELGNWYFVNKISNFNPEKSLQPVEFDLIKMPWVRNPELPEQPDVIEHEWILQNGIWSDLGIWIDTENWKDFLN